MDIFQSNLLLNSLIAGILASGALGVIGTYAVARRIIFISGGIAHTIYGGIGLGFLLGFNPMWGAFAFALSSAVIISTLRKNRTQNYDSIISVMWTFGMALGIIFVSFSDGYAPNINSYLFGNILLVSEFELLLLAILNIFILLFVYLFYKELQAISFDEEFAESLGVPSNFFNLILLLFISITIVLSIRLVGVILVISLLSIPPSIALKYSKSLKEAMTISACIGCAFCIAGLTFSYYFNLPSGAAIILIASLVFFINEGMFLFKDRA